MAGCLDGASAGEERDQEGLPETQKDDEFDGRDLEKRFVLSDVVLDLDIELDKAVHGNRDGDCLEAHDPDVREGGIERLETIQAGRLSNDRYHGEEDADETILEDCDPDHLEALSVMRSELGGTRSR